MSYDPNYYKEHKASMQASQKKWRDRIAAEKKAKKEKHDLLFPPKTKEEKKRDNQRLLKIRYKYNIDGYADNARQRYRDRYHSDPDFRKKRADDLRIWRKNKKNI